MSTNLPTTEYPTFEALAVTAERILTVRLHQKSDFATADHAAFTATPASLPHLLELEAAGAFTRGQIHQEFLPPWLAEHSSLFLGCWDALRTYLETYSDRIQARVDAERAA